LTFSSLQTLPWALMFTLSALQPVISQQAASEVCVMTHTIKRTGWAKSKPLTRIIIKSY